MTYCWFGPKSVAETDSGFRWGSILVVRRGPLRASGRHSAVARGTVDERSGNVGVAALLRKTARLGMETRRQTTCARIGRTPEAEIG